MNPDDGELDTAAPADGDATGNGQLAFQRVHGSKQHATIDFRALAEKPLPIRLALLQGPEVIINCVAEKFAFRKALPLAVSPAARSEHKAMGYFPIQNLDPLLSLVTDLDAIVAAEPLGMDGLVSKFRGYWWHRLQITPVVDIGFEKLKVFNELLTPNTESSIVRMVIKVLAVALAPNNKIDDHAHTQFLAWLNQLPKLQGRVHEAFHGIVKQREQRRAMDRQKQPPSNATLAQQQLKQQREMVIQTARKVDRSGAGTITAEEAHLLGRRPGL
ncbi:hypothetical protein BU23DRAFT_602333 [Bimuria novae-zelandiae CBS 107.79]|uniref:Uncharacterized protein n=1 Tax=Bimuria novae-zelandiae CBS 107.79 TaxID=1447943 RepID=A0A6A5UUA2_9PLEO|nr:hypothetical protein BU23DRAFT_602333 [Bimuria novae-zelandiae CBS 107.79]